MVGQDVQHLYALMFAVFVNLVTEHIFLARLMRPLVECVTAAQLRLLDTPAGEHFGQLRYVFLGIAAIHSQRVQFHDFARVVFIQAAGPPVLRLLIGLRAWNLERSSAAHSAPRLRTIFC